MSVELLAVALGLLVGLSLGALGGGGSTLAVPILVFVAGLEAQAATTASLLVVGTAAAVGVVDHYRLGNVRLGAGLSFGLAGVVGSRLGTEANQRISENALLLGFSLLVILVAALMYRSTRPTAHTPPPPPLSITGGGLATATRHHQDQRLSTLGLAKLAGAATVVGVLTGLFGVGGGFAIVPALTLLLGFRAKEAIGTSLVVIAVNAMVALGLRAGQLELNWELVLPFLATVTIGVVLGSRLSSHIAADQLTRGFAIMLAAVATYTATTVFI